MLAAPVLEWIAEAHRLRSGLADLESADAATRRRAARDHSDQVAQIFTAEAPAGVVIDEVTVRAAPRWTRVRRYRPPGAGDALLPTQIWMHGGGFVSGTVDELVNERLCSARSAATGVQILAVEYRLAPENAYPAPVDDAVAVFDAALTDPRLQVDGSRVGIGGNSAGGCIAASAALRIRDTRETSLVHQLLEVPLVIFEPFGASMDDFDLNVGPLAASPSTDPYDVAQAYLEGGRADPYMVPLDADLAGLPPTLVQTAEFDPLRDGGEEYAVRLRAAGVTATGVRGTGHLHASCALTATWDAARHWQQTAASAMREAYDSGPVQRRARYDGVAEWYDAQIEGAPHRHQVLRANLPTGDGMCLDVGSGTGRDLAVMEGFGWTPVGVELSTDQLRLARRRSQRLVQGDAERLPFTSSIFGLVVSSWTSTDVEDFDGMLGEVGRVLRPGGRFLFYGVHPCFNGPHVQTRPDQSRVVHPTYREARRHLSAPWWGADGIRTKAGGMRHVPLADFINAFVNAGLRLDHVAEPDEEPVPNAIVIRATRTDG